MNHTLYRNLLFLCLLAVAPAIFFLIQVITITSTANIFSALLGSVANLFPSELSSKNLLGILLFFVTPIAIFSALYWCIAWVISKVLNLIPSLVIRATFQILVLVGVLGMSQMSIYGTGGHGADKSGPLQATLSAFGNSGGLSYLVAIILLALPSVIWHGVRTIKARR